MSSISGISGSGIQPIQFPSLDSLTKSGAADATQGASGGSDFGSSITDALSNLQSTQNNSDNLATQMATGKLTDIQDYMIAANQAEIGTQLTVAVRDKAVAAFNQIMNMQM
jgi:flagellar hook-basal body complex protein FliE